MINNLLEIFIITYNRSQYLKDTLFKLTSDISPIRGCNITVLDNNSIDDTGSIVKNFMQKYSNIRYIKNNRNIGLMGNFAKAVELSKLNYFWCLSDNDDLDFSGWEEVQGYINDGYALINVSTVIKKSQNNLASILSQSVFLPAMIYNTKYINDTTMCHVMCNIYTLFSQCTLTCLIYNQAKDANKCLAIASKDIVRYSHNIKIENLNKYNCDRCDGGPKRFMSNNQHVSVISSFNVLEDSALYSEIIDFLSKYYLSFPYISQKLLLSKSCGGSDNALFWEFFFSLNKKNKLKLLFSIFSAFFNKIIRIKK